MNISFKIPGRLVERAAGEGDTVGRAWSWRASTRSNWLSQRDRAKAGVARSRPRCATAVATSIDFQGETLEGQIASSAKPRFARRKRVWTNC